MLPPVWNYPFTYRAVKGSPLSNTEVDDNFKAVAERAEYAQTVAETLPNEIALTAAAAATYTANQIAQSALATAQAAAASAAAVVTGGTATLTPAAGKIPLAGGSGYIDNGWINLLNIGTTAVSARSALGLGTAATTNNGSQPGQNIINSAGSAGGNISYSGTLLNTTGNSNTAAGTNALVENTTGSINTAVGSNALMENTTGGRNTAVGRDALRHITGYNNCGGFGYNSQATASNQIQLGDSDTTVYAYGAVQNRSDARDKAEVRDTVLGLDFINAIRPVDYKLDMREDYRVELGDHPTEEQRAANKLANIQADGTHTRKRYHHGVIAQEVESVIDTFGIDFGGFQDHSKIGGDDVLSIGYAEFIAPLIKAVQELSVRVKELEGKIEHEELDDDLP